jgi:hypothetical protein
MWIFAARGRPCFLIHCLIQILLLKAIIAIRIVQRATAQFKTWIFRDYGVVEATPGFQAGWSDCMYIFCFPLYCSFCLLIWNFRVSFWIHEGALPYRSSAQMSCREEVGVSYFALEILEPQTACHLFRSAAILRYLTNSVGRSLLWRAFKMDSRVQEQCDIISENWRATNRNMKLKF